MFNKREICVLENCMDFWFVTTDHLTDRIWFKDDEDYKVGMNLVAVLVVAISVDILAFCLMSNHVHFVLVCPEEKARQFVEEYKKRYAQYLHHKYGVKDFLRRNHVDIQSISGMNESMERAVAYTQMNPVAAGICLSPIYYPWGTGDSFFRVKARKGRRLDTFSERARRRMLHSAQKMPGHFLVGEEGYIFPESYVKVDMIETVFRTPQRMNYFLQNSSKAKRRIDSMDVDMPAFRDQVLTAAMPDLCQSLFKKRSIQDLSDDEQSELLKQLRFRFSANVNQLARVTGFSYKQVVELLDRA